jgi:Beta-lactamase
MTVRQLLSHQAGLPVLDIPLTIADLADLGLVAAAFALQRPLWEPGTGHGYHGISLGKPREVRWPRSPRTEATHQLLVRDLGTWIGILGSRQTRSWSWL